MTDRLGRFGFANRTEMADKACFIGRALPVSRRSLASGEMNGGKRTKASDAFFLHEAPEHLLASICWRAFG